MLFSRREVAGIFWGGPPSGWLRLRGRSGGLHWGGDERSDEGDESTTFYLFCRGCFGGSSGCSGEGGDWERWKTYDRGDYRA